MNTVDKKIVIAYVLFHQMQEAEGAARRVLKTQYEQALRAVEAAEAQASAG